MGTSLPQDNPFVALRRTAGLSQADFARALGVSLPALWAAENGTTAHPEGVFRALRAVGCEPAGLTQAYERWRMAALEKERGRLKARIASTDREFRPAAGTGQA